MQALHTRIKDTLFDEKITLHHMKHYLPSQTPIKDFIHHNTLHAFQDMKFYDAIFKAASVFGYQTTLQLSEFRKLHKNGRIKNDVLERVISETKGFDQFEIWKKNLLTKKYNSAVTPKIGLLRNEWKKQYKIDLDNLVQPLLFRLVCNYLDQGVALNQFPITNLGFLEAIRELEKNSFVSIFKNQRAKQLLFSGNCNLNFLLKILVGKEAFYEQYLFDQQFSHPGWSGIVSAIEDGPHTLLDTRKISLSDFIIFELLLEIDAIESGLGEKWEPLAHNTSLSPTNLFAETPASESR